MVRFLLEIFVSLIRLKKKSIVILTHKRGSNKLSVPDYLILNDVYSLKVNINS